MKTICITGTKGKTTVTRALASMLHHIGETTLRVDTDGHYINEKQRSTLQDSKNLFDKAPTVCPGKYLIEMKGYYPDFTAILETAVGSHGINGLGYSFHSMGIFTNVFEDHIGFGSIKTRKDLAEAKSFVFSRISDNGVAVFNADDEYVCKQLDRISGKNVKLFPVGIHFDSFDSENHLKNGGQLFTCEEGTIVVKTSNSTKKIVEVSEIPWTFDGLFKPSIYNLMLVLGGIDGLGYDITSNMVRRALRKYQPDKEGGRLTLFHAKNGTKILLDYAHEKYSLLEIAKLARQICTGRVIGVLRLAPDRTNEAIIETGKYISREYDYSIIYDKIDGVRRKDYFGKNTKVKRGVGEVSSLFLKGITEAGESILAEQIVLEEDAIKKASKVAREDDVVIVIAGDNKKDTIQYIKKYFEVK